VAAKSPEIVMSFNWALIPPHVKVVAVSKLQPKEKILALHRSRGHLDFGENYVQEALEKIGELKHLGLRWHLIGGLQTNKVKYLSDQFSLIHSVDSIKLARKISDEVRAKMQTGHRQKILLQLNVAEEDSKGGFDLSEFENSLSDLKQLSGIEICGLMTMPPLQGAAEANRRHFRRLAEWSRQIQQFWPSAKELSMGTSSDFQVAIEEGATLVRLGSILFGERSRGAQ